MKEQIKELKELAYKGKFSIYHKPKQTIIRTYRPNGLQNKIRDKTLENAIKEMIELLKKQYKTGFNNS